MFQFRKNSSVDIFTWTFGWKKFAFFLYFRHHSVDRNFFPFSVQLHLCAHWLRMPSTDQPLTHNMAETYDSTNTILFSWHNTHTHIHMEGKNKKLGKLVIVAKVKKENFFYPLLPSWHPTHPCIGKDRKKGKIASTILWLALHKRTSPFSAQEEKLLFLSKE